MIKNPSKVKFVQNIYRNGKFVSTTTLSLLIRSIVTFIYQPMSSTGKTCDNVNDYITHGNILSCPPNTHGASI